jgi:Right handed beta helix region
MEWWLNSLPPDTVVHAPLGACYLVDQGVKIWTPKGLTIDGGTWRDDTVPRSTKSPSGQTVLWFVGGSGVTLDNLTIEGVNPGGFHLTGAFQAGIRSDGVVGLVIDAVNVVRTFGDGLELTPLRGDHDQNGTIIRPTENVTVTDLTVLGAGRNGVSLASVTNATLTDVNFLNIGLDDVDAESDQANEGATNITIDGCTAGGGGAALFANGGASAGAYTYDITVENCTMESMQNGFAVYAHEPNWAVRPKGPITFTDDQLICGHSSYVACVDITGGNYIISNSRIWVPPGYAGEAAYSAHDRTNLTFDNDFVSGYGSLGTVDRTSTVTISGGVWVPYP